MKPFRIFLMVGLAIISLTAFSQEKAGKKDTTQHVKLYTCPIHDSVAMKQPGNCPMCGMKLQLSTKEQMKSDVAKAYSCPIHIDEQSNTPGKCSKCGANLALSPKEKMKVKAMNNYTCPMHNDVKTDKPGKCPTCGMQLTQVKEEAKAVN
jgi:transcription initiation factor IIE alpha subunit